MPQRLSEMEQGKMVVTLKSYLVRLEEEEARRPESLRRRVPQLDELAAEIGINRVTLSDMVNNKGRYLNLELGGRIITALMRRGFRPTPNDILAYVPPDEG